MGRKGGGSVASAQGTSTSRGPTQSRGIQGEILKSRVPEMAFPVFWGEILVSLLFRSNKPNFKNLIWDLGEGGR